MKKSRILSTTILVTVTWILVFASVMPVFASPPGSWTTRASIPATSAVEGYGAAQVRNIHYYVGGYHLGDTNMNQRYDKASDKWLTNGAMIPGPPRGETAAVAAGGFVYLVGGRCPGPCNLLQRYDPGTDSWTTLSPLLVPVVTEHVVAAVEGKIYAVGGRAGSIPGSGGGVNALQIYNIATNTWSFGAMLPIPVSDSAVISVGTKIYAFGGSSFAGPTPLSTTLIYDIPSNSWSMGASMITARSDASVGFCGDNIHVFGGSTAIPFVLTNVHEVYNTITNTWTSGTPIPSLTGAGTEVQAITQLGKIYIVGGGIFGSGGSDSVQNVWNCK